MKGRRGGAASYVRKKGGGNAVCCQYRQCETDWEGSTPYTLRSFIRPGGKGLVGRRFFNEAQGEHRIPGCRLPLRPWTMSKSLREALSTGFARVARMPFPFFPCLSTPPIWTVWHTIRSSAERFQNRRRQDEQLILVWYTD